VGTLVLTIDTYNQAEAEARRREPPAAIMAFTPVTFQAVGFPCYIETDAELGKFTDLLNVNPHCAELYEEKKFFRPASYFTGFTPDEAELIRYVSDGVADMTQRRCGVRTKPLFAPLPQIGSLRLINALAGLAGKRPLSVLEIGPGLGYLGIYLGLTGHRYASTDVTQSLYLWQHALLHTFFAAELEDHAGDADRPVTMTARIIHLPWWKFARLHEAPPAVDVVIAHAVLAEMSSVALHYTLELGRRMLRDSPCPLLLVNSFGNPLQTTPEAVIALASSLGYAHVLQTLVHGFSPAPERLPAAIFSLDNDVPLYRPSGRAGELSASEFMAASPAETPEVFRLNQFLFGWAPPVS
jgi:hypothetical protein